jgi:hypothetical protein
MSELRFQAGDVVFDPAGNVSLLEEGDGVVGTPMAGSTLRLAYRASPEALNRLNGLNPGPETVVYLSGGWPACAVGTLAGIEIAALYGQRFLHPKSALHWLEKCVKATEEQKALGRAERQRTEDEASWTVALPAGLGFARRFRMARGSSSVMQFELYQVVAVYEGGRHAYQRRGWVDSSEHVFSFERAERFAHGEVKFDGVMKVWFDHENETEIELCRGGLADLHVALVALHDAALMLMPEHAATLGDGGEA